MGRCILIFGAGLNQLSLIRAARELGVTSVVLDVTEDAPGGPLADHFYVVAGDDYATTLSIARRHQADGLVTSQMEKPMRLMARLAAELGLPFHSPEVTERSLDKWLMKRAFLAGGIPCAEGCLIRAGESLPEGRMREIGFPLILKPKDATSSQGVFRVDSMEEARGFLDIARRFSRSGEVILEEFLDGPEFSVESITWQGKTTVVQMTEKFVSPFPCTVEMGHLQPAPLADSQRAAVEQCVLKAVEAIGIDNSASHAEVKLTAKGPRLVEIGARLGGDFISSYLTSTSCGVNMDKAAIQVALGEEPDLAHQQQQYAYIKYLQLPVGERVGLIRDYGDLLEQEEVVLAHISQPVGSLIPQITESRKRPGFVIVKGGSREEVLRLGDEYALRLMCKFSFQREQELAAE